MKSFFLETLSTADGPGIFAHRLLGELINQGCRYDQLNPSNKISFITGYYNPRTHNILRLDGLYLDSADKYTDGKNAPIFGCYSTFDTVVFQSEFSKSVYEKVTSLVRPKNTVIYNGVPNTFRPADRRANKKNKIVIASAKWRRHKRLEETIEAFRDRRLHDVTLIVLAGEEYLEGPGAELAGKLPQNVMIMSKIHFESLPAQYRYVDAMVHIAWLDWCPNTVIEALACGIPVLCSSNGGTKELVRNNGLAINLEEQYVPGTMVDLYNPPDVDIKTISDGILSVLDMEPGFERPDLSIANVAKQYIGIME